MSSFLFHNLLQNSMRRRGITGIVLSENQKWLVLFCYFKFGLATSQTSVFVSELLKRLQGASINWCFYGGGGLHSSCSYSKLPISMTALLSLYLIKLLLSFSVKSRYSPAKVLKRL